MKKLFYCLCILWLLNKCKSDPIVLTIPEHLIADSDNAGLILPTGFRAITVAANLGTTRHIVVTDHNDIYLKIMGKIGTAKAIIRLRDTNGDGKSDETIGFGNYSGTGLALKNGYLYASSDEEVFRYKLNNIGEVINTNEPEKIITNLKRGNQHASKSIALDNDNHIYVNIGAYSNSCQVLDRTLG